MNQKTASLRPGNAPLDYADIVIIGNGIAGLTAALEARRLAPDKSITIVTHQQYSTINTPALKQFAIGKLSREQLLAHPTGTERRAQLTTLYGDVEYIQAQQRYLQMRDQRYLGYGSLLIATGSSAQGLPESLVGKHYDGVLTLHRLHDYLDLRRRLPETKNAVVVGGGVHAAETIMILQKWGIKVHWLIRGSTFLRGLLDNTASELVLNHLRRQGVRVYTDTEIGSIVGHIGCVAGVVTTQEKLIACELVLACTGTKPALGLARNCSIPLYQQQGIIVDELMRTNVPQIYAAGDVAAVRDPQTGHYQPRAQWYAANTQGRLAGLMLAGRSDQHHQTFGVPWHATHVGELSMLSVGHPLSEDPQAKILSDTSQGGYRRLTFLDDRLIGYLSLGQNQPDSMAIKSLIDEGYPVHTVLKPLLKGNLTARDFVGQKRTHQVAQLMATGVKGQARKTVQLSPPATSFRDPITPIPDQRNLGQELVSSSSGRQSRRNLTLPLKRRED